MKNAILFGCHATYVVVVRDDDAEDDAEDDADRSRGDENFTSVVLPVFV